MRTTLGVSAAETCHHGSVTAEDPLLTQAELAALFRVDVRTIRRWTRAGMFDPVVRTPGTVRYVRSVVERVATGGREVPHAHSEPCHCASS